MVTYTCDRCQTTFDNKTKYDRHIGRKIPCLITDVPEEEPEKIISCDICNKEFSRPDALTRHNKSKTHQDALKKLNVNDTNTDAKIKIKVDKVNIINNNCVINQKNVGIKNNISLVPYGNSELDDLSMEDKIEIFSSNESPIIMIVIKTNLNPKLPQYHNVGYKDLNSAYGFIFNGEAWPKKRIEYVMDDLLGTKEADLITLHEEIKEYLTEKENRDIKCKLDSIRINVKPKLEHDFKFKRKLITNLKNQFYNRRDLLTKSMINSGKPVIGSDKYSTRNILKGGITIEDIEQGTAHTKIKINQLKSTAMYLLDEMDTIDEQQYETIVAIIDKTTHIPSLRSIVNSIINAFCIGSEIDKKVINKRIARDIEMIIYCKNYK